MTLLMSRRQVLGGSLIAVPAPARPPARASALADRSRLDRAVDEAAVPVMEENSVPGMAVAVTVEGTRRFFSYGVASREAGQRVTEDTIFEVGSISKVFTATLASYAQARGTLSLSDSASRHLPALAGSSFDGISLLDLGTYTAGGLPLQFPAGVNGREGMVDFFRSWRPAYPAGTHRLYSNPSVGLFGHLAARSMGGSFDDLMEQELFPALSLTRTYIKVPRDQAGAYAFGSSNDGRPIRVAPGVLDSQAYGVKSTAADMIRFVEANMNGPTLDQALRRSIAATHRGHYEVGGMTQGLGWEMYAYPTDLDRLLAGNSPQIMFRANRVSRPWPPLPQRGDPLINKTGSTNGFGAYVALVPARGIGVVVLANRNYPIPARVRVAHRVLAALDGRPGSTGAR